MKETNKALPRSSSFNRAMLFIAPSVMITAISIVLFSRLVTFTQTQFNTFSLTIIGAIILSLIGMAGMQVIIYRITESREYFADGGALRGIRAGMLYSLIFSVIISAATYLFFTNVLNFSMIDFLYFSALLFLFSSTWILVSAFWASEKYGQIGIIFTLGYALIFFTTYNAYLFDPLYAISGYTGGTLVLCLALMITALIVFPKPKSSHKFWGDIIRLPGLFSQNMAAILFNVFYVAAIFLDKIIVWVYQGVTSGQGILVTGTYAMGSFLGLMPMFGIAVIAYFSSRAKPLVDARYDGSYNEIQKRIVKYKSMYFANFNAAWLIALIIGAATVFISYYVIPDPYVIQILITVSLGSVFLVTIVFNSVVLALFGKYSISAYSMAAVIIAELATIPFVSIDAWYCSLGYLAGSIAGFLISFAGAMRLFANYEYHMFGLLLKLKTE